MIGSHSGGRVLLELCHFACFWLQMTEVFAQEDFNNKEEVLFSAAGGPRLRQDPEWACSRAKRSDWDLAPGALLYALPRVGFLFSLGTRSAVQGGPSRPDCVWHTKKVGFFLPPAAYQMQEDFSRSFSAYLFLCGLRAQMWGTFPIPATIPWGGNWVYFRPTELSPEAWEPWGVSSS